MLISIYWNICTILNARALKVWRRKLDVVKESSCASVTNKFHSGKLCSAPTTKFFLYAHGHNVYASTYMQPIMQGGFKGGLQATLCQKLWGGECRVSGNRKPRSPVIRVSLRIRPPFASFNVFSLIRRGETAKCIWLAFLGGWNSFCLAFTTFLRQRTVSKCLILALTEERHCAWHSCRLFLLPITGTREIIYHKIPVSEVVSCSLLRRACEIFSLECF